MAMTAPASDLLAFGVPWALGLLLLLPALWWLLKALPPAPRALTFPPIRLLAGLDAQRPTPARMPLWLLILRLCLAAILILCLAHPLLNPAPADKPTHVPLLLVVDDGWAAASDWSARRAWLDARLAAAARADRPVMVLSTAPQPGGGPPLLAGPMTASQARAAMAAALPRPWPTDRARALETLRAQPDLGETDIEWLTDGVAGESEGGARAFFHALLALDPGVLTFIGRSSAALVRAENATDPNRLDFTIDRPRPNADANAALRASDASGLVVASVPVASDRSRTQAAVALPVELRNRVERIDLGPQAGAAGVWLMDESARLRTVGVFDGGIEHGGQPLLDAVTYIAKALKPSADVQIGSAADLVAAKPAVIFTGDWVPSGVLDELAPWVEAGGMVVRFAGPGLAEGDAPAELLPTPLVHGGRALGGQLSWTTPQHLAPFDDASPFAGLAIPDDVTVTTQVLADPDRMDQARVWAKLADGTPLVTARQEGRGWVVLCHVTATPDWSTLPLSGIFPALLQRLVATARGGAVPSSKPLPPYRVLDGLGRLTTPAAALQPASPATPVGPDHPPGLYGDAAGYVAVNLGPSVQDARPLDISDIPQLHPMQAVAAQIDLTPVLGLAAVALMLADMIIHLWPRRRLAAALILLAAGLAVHPAQAAQVDAQAALAPRLGYVLTGDEATDAASRAGLAQLSTLLGARSTAILAAPKGLDLEAATWVFYPLIYWPVRPDQPLPSAQAAANIRRYLSHGGMILFDRQQSAAPALRRLGDSLNLPVVIPLPGDHVLTRSFYLIGAASLAVNGDPLWIEAARADNDGVASILISDGQWATLWARGPSEETESAFRFGINLCLYALTGNYKADQVHVHELLERIGR
jgi:hypothetical protein